MEYEGRDGIRGDNISDCATLYESHGSILEFFNPCPLGYYRDLLA